MFFGLSCPFWLAPEGGLMIDTHLYIFYFFLSSSMSQNRE